MDHSRRKIESRIKKIMFGDEKPDSIWLPALLKAVSAGYGGAVRLRTAGYRRGMLTTRRLPCKVISIGNLTLGGTGKTPLVMTLAPMLADCQLKAAVISRGYKGRFEKRGGIVSDGRQILMGPSEAGDEPYLLARRLIKWKIPVLIGGDRYRTGNLAVQTFDPDVILLDDGFQHIRLARDIDLVLLDSQQPFGNESLFPRGSLREPISALARADIVAVTRSDGINAESRSRLKAKLNGLSDGAPVFFTRHQPYVAALKPAIPPAPGAEKPESEIPLSLLQGKKVFAFSGIARNEDFKETLKQCGCRLVDGRFFSDHHPYRRDELTALFRAARQSGAEFAATTEKDYVRFAEGFKAGVSLVVIGIRIEFEDNGMQLSELISRRLQMPAATD